MRKRIVTSLIMGGMFAVAVGCGSATQDEKYAHLRDVAEKGADTHFVLINENKETTREVCQQHYKLFTDGVPADDNGFVTSQWQQLSEDYFVDSCVKGEPRVIQTRSSATTSPTAASRVSLG